MKLMRKMMLISLSSVMAACGQPNSQFSSDLNVTDHLPAERSWNKVLECNNYFDLGRLVIDVDGNDPNMYQAVITDELAVSAIVQWAQRASRDIPNNFRVYEGGKKLVVAPLKSKTVLSTPLTLNNFVTLETRGMVPPPFSYAQIIKRDGLNELAISIPVNRGGEPHRTESWIFNNCQIAQ